MVVVGGVVLDLVLFVLCYGVGFCDFVFCIVGILRDVRGLWLSCCMGCLWFV